MRYMIILSFTQNTHVFSGTGITQDSNFKLEKA